MKYRIVPSTKFKKDLKLIIKRGYNISLLDAVVELLANGEPLSEKYRDHALSGNFAGCRECHITRIGCSCTLSDAELLLYLTRTGTHSDLV
ncbi:MAG: type II toxin-antitoxin system YafQ family toxin [Eisenbergiella sp.]